MLPETFKSTLKITFNTKKADDVIDVAYDLENEKWKSINGYAQALNEINNIEKEKGELLIASQ